MPEAAIAQEDTAFFRRVPSLALLLMGGALASDAVLQPDLAKPGRLRAVGDPTEGALVVAALRFGLSRERLDAAFPRVAEVPFDSERKRMTTVHRVADCTAWIGECEGLVPGIPVVFTKGAVDSLLTVSSHVWDAGRLTPLDQGWRERITSANDSLAHDGMRVLGVAFRFAPSGEAESLEKPERLERDLVFVGPLLGMPLPLLPFQILWLNLVTDGVLGLGIGVEPAERGVMKRYPRAPSDSILARGLGLEVLWQGVLLGVVNLAVAWWAWSTRQAEWQTTVVTAVVLLQVFQAQAGRSSRESVFRLNPVSNKALLGATGLILGPQTAVIYLPPLHAIFGTLPMSANQMAILPSAGVFVLCVVEASEVLGRLDSSHTAHRR